MSTRGTLVLPLLGTQAAILHLKVNSGWPQRNLPAELIYTAGWGCDSIIHAGGEIQPQVPEKSNDSCYTVLCLVLFRFSISNFYLTVF